MATKPDRPARYNIVRHYRNRIRNRKIIRRGLTLADARMWCQRDDTHGPRWFDGFEEAK